MFLFAVSEQLIGNSSELLLLKQYHCALSAAAILHPYLICIGKYKKNTTRVLVIMRKLKKENVVRRQKHAWQSEWV
jgi:hypothetical protein